MILNNGCAAVNSCVIQNIPISGSVDIAGAYQIEVMSPKHGGYKTNIVANYIWMDNKKYCIYYWLDGKHGMVLVDFFRKKEDLEPYTRRNYKINEVPAKYNKIVRVLQISYGLIFR